VGKIEISPEHGLDERIEALIRQAGGRGPAVMALIEHGAPETEPAVEPGTRTVVMVRLSLEEAQAVEDAHTAKGMSRAEWLRALIRRQIGGQRPLSRTERGYMRRALGELQTMRRELSRIRATVAAADRTGRDIDAPLRRLAGCERKLVATAKAIHHGFLGEDGYWRRLDDENASGS
jgi:hypothetical protein